MSVLLEIVMWLLLFVGVAMFITGFFLERAARKRDEDFQRRLDALGPERAHYVYGYESHEDARIARQRMPRPPVRFE